MKMLGRSMAGLLLGFLIQSVHALQNDSEQPATLYADELEMDFSAGVRVYRGNVEFTQGSLRLNCNELTTYLGKNDELDKAICLGNPGRYQQLPEGHTEEVVGTAIKITMDQVKQVVTLHSQAKIVQGGRTMTGKTITYDMVTETASVKGDGLQSQRGAEKAPADSASTSDAAPAPEKSSAGIPVENDEYGRPGIVIQPRKKKAE